MIEAMKQALEGMELVTCGDSTSIAVLEVAKQYARQAIAEAEKQELVSIKKVAEEHGINLPTEFVPKRDESKAAIKSLANQCAALVWERDELQKQVWRYEKQKPATHPPKREWVGLTDEEMHECWDSPLTPLGMKHVRMIEAKLKEKNT